MTKKMWLTGVFLLVLIAAVIYVIQRGKETTEHRYVFEGSGEYWSAEYEVKAAKGFTEKQNKTDYHSDSSAHFKLLYKNELSDISGLDKIAYSYKGTSSGGSGTEEFSQSPKSKEVISRPAGGGNGAFERRDSRIEVTVEWQGKKESFYLTVK